MKTTHKQVLALLLAVALLLLLCACAQIQQLKGTDSATLPETLAGQASETQSEDPTQHSEITESQRAQHSEATEPQQAQYIGSEEGKNSLLQLRDKIDFSQTMFGMAYLGYVGGLFEEGFEAGFPAWLWETNAALLLEYHGAVTWGTSMEQAHYRLECLEQLATVTLHLRTLGIHRTMPESLVKALEGLRPAWGIQ